MQVDDRVPDDFIVRDIEINRVVCAQPGGAPINLHDLSEALVHLKPIADLVGLADLQRHPGDDSAEHVLGREGQPDGGDP